MAIQTNKTVTTENPQPKPKTEPEVEAPSTVDDEPEIVRAPTYEEAKTDQQMARLSRIDQMRDYFKTQKRVRVKIRNDGDVPVQINGYTFLVQANVAVDVPEDVAQLLEDAGYI